MRFSLMLLLACVPALPQSAKEDELKNPFADRPEAVETGGKLFAESCSACHGPHGEGGRGPNLVTGENIRGATNRQLFGSIKNGVKGTDMPPAALPDEKIWQLLTFVKSDHQRRS